MGRLRFLFDVGVGKFAEQAIAEEGHDVLAIRDLDPAMADDAMLELARQQRRVIVTMDADFGTMVFGQGSATEGIVLLRTDDAPSGEKARILTGIVREHADELVGSFTVFARGKVRIHRLKGT